MGTRISDKESHNSMASPMASTCERRRTRSLKNIKTLTKNGDCKISKTKKLKASDALATPTTVGSSHNNCFYNDDNMEKPRTVS